MKKKVIDELNALYKNTDMGSTAISNILSKTSDEKLKTELSSQLEMYKNHSKQLENQMAFYGEVPKGAGNMTKAYTNMAIKMSMLKDNSTSNIAEKMIQGTNMGIIELNKLMNSTNNKRIQNQAQEILNNEQEYIDRLKQFL